jgi:endonuclease/exonuclease/phosphatase family metal-dependent hydrolase
MRKAAWIAWMVAGMLGAGCQESTEQSQPQQESGFNSGNNGDDNQGNNAEANNAEAYDGPRVRIATWNLKLFFDTQCDLGTCGPDEREEQPTQEEFDARVEQIVEGLEAIDADVVVFQEIESEACLDALRERVGDRYNVWVMGETRQAASLDTAMIARADDDDAEVITHRQDPFVLESGEQSRFLREFLEVRMEIDGHEVIVFGAHFKSKRDDDPEQRLAEAARAREVALDTADEREEALIVLAGDLNDTPDSDTLDLLLADGLLIRVSEELGEDAWTINSGGNLSLIDHLLLVRGRGKFIAGSAEVVRDRNGLGGSDHAALAADFKPFGE